MRVLLVLLLIALVAGALWWGAGRPDLPVDELAGVMRRELVVPPDPKADLEQCFARLDETPLKASRIADFSTGQGCVVEGAVRVAGGATGLSGPFIATCRLALAFSRFETEVLQPAAQRRFGQRVVRIEHLGSYNCRPVRDAAWPRLSQHAFANALDVTGFVLGDGRRITIAADWGRDGPRGAFLREVADGACGPFRTVLTPAWDRSHATHFHLDTGRWRVCS